MPSRLSCKTDNVKNILKSRKEDEDKERKKNTNLKSKVNEELMMWLSIIIKLLFPFH